MAAISTLRRLLPAALLFVALGGAQAQTGTATPATQPAPSEEAIFGALNGGAAGLAALSSYLTDTPRQNLGQRVGEVFKSLRERGGRDGQQSLLTAVDRVVAIARISLEPARLMKLVVGPGYVPQHAVAAFDFGPKDSPPAAGFERVAPGDERVEGQLSAPRRGNETGMQSDGISDIQHVHFAVPGGDPGPYRIVLATRNLPEIVADNAFFGREVVINGASSPVRGGPPSQWLDMAMLNSGSGPNDPAARGNNGIRVRDFGADELAEGGRQQGGTLVIEAFAVDGALDIELRGQRPTFLTGLLAERADGPSDLILSSAARDVLVPIEERLALESEIDALVAGMLEEIATAAGPRDPELPDPLFRNDLTASPS